MTETKIQQVLIPYLRSEGYQPPWQPPNRNDQGPDIVGYHPDRHHLWIIEAKGDVNPSQSDRTGSIGRRRPLMEHWDRYANGVLMNGSRNPKMGLFFQPISSHMDWLSQKEKVTAFSVAKFGQGYVRHCRSICFLCNLMFPLL